MRFLQYSMLLAASLLPTAVFSQPLNLADTPLFVTGGKTALVQLIVQRDNNLFFEAYPSYVYINSDGVLAIRYKPQKIDHVGYFDANFFYVMSSGDHLVASAKTADKKCSEALVENS